MQRRRAIQYDSARRRVWILGQRCHHGAVGALFAAAAVAWLGAGALARPARASLGVARTVTVVGVGGALMVHDRDDRAIWFERGAGTQP